MKTIALYSIKGGVGKTAAAVNLAYLSAQQHQSLICDLDPQGASSYYFRISASPKFDSGKFLNSTKKIHRNIKGTDFENLDLLPSDFSYRNLDIELSEEKKPRKRLQKNIESLAEEWSRNSRGVTTRLLRRDPPTDERIAEDWRALSALLPVAQRTCGW